MFWFCYLKSFQWLTGRICVSEKSVRIRLILFVLFEHTMKRGERTELARINTSRLIVYISYK